MKLLYLSNLYPSTSLTFIRREIHALERRGITIIRCALRRQDGNLVDPLDVSEREKTQYILRKGAGALVLSVLRITVSRPASFLAALLLALRSMRRTARPAPLHLIYLAEACVIAEICSKEDVDHIHAHFGTNSAQVAMLTHVISGCSFSFTVHGPDEFDEPSFLALREKVARANFVCAVSHFTRSQLLRWTDLADWPKIRVVRCGVDASFVRDLPPASFDRSTFVCVARLSGQKGQLVLLDAMAEVLRTHPLVRLRLVGDGELRPAIEARIRECGLQDHVEIVGWIDGAAVIEEVSRARALVLASFAEGLPVVIMEAMALGRPILATNVAGVAELVGDGREGWIYPAGSVDALANAMRDCLDTADEVLAEMGKRGRIRCLSLHHIDVVIRELETAFLQTTSRRRRSS